MCIRDRAYGAAVKAGQADAFRQAIDARRTAAPDNLLYAAWFYRLQHAAAGVKESFVRWGWVIPLAGLNGLLFWWLSDFCLLYTSWLWTGGGMAWTRSAPSCPRRLSVCAPAASSCWRSAGGRERRRRRWPGRHFRRRASKSDPILPATTASSLFRPDRIEGTTNTRVCDYA